VKILAINGSYRPKGTTTRLTEKALEGAASQGADTDMVLLVDKDVRYCTNCLTCYKDTTSQIAPCPIDDDVSSILEAIRDADGVLFTSPVHSGFVSGLMVAFFERACWRLLRPTGNLMGLHGTPEARLPAKTRAIATIVSAGGVPTELRKYCDMGSPWLQDMAACLCNGECVGDMYAGAVLTKELAPEEYSRLYFFRELTDAQLQEAHDLGAAMARAVTDGTVRPYDPMRLIQSLDQPQE